MLIQYLSTKRNERHATQISKAKPTRMNIKLYSPRPDCDTHLTTPSGVTVTQEIGAEGLSPLEITAIRLDGCSLGGKGNSRHKLA